MSKVGLGRQEIREIDVDLIKLVCGIGTIRDVSELGVDLVGGVVENEIGSDLTGAERFGDTTRHFDASNGGGTQPPDLSAHLSISGGWCNVVVSLCIKGGRS